MTIEDKDSVSAAKAGLELMLMDNQHLLNHFSQLLAELEEIEVLPQTDKHKRFKDLESKGAFKYKGVDIRLFQATDHRPLSPHDFLVRTQRRLQNTHTLVGQLVSTGKFEQGQALQTEIENLTSRIVDDSDAADVQAFRQQVEALRNSEMFRAYLEHKKTFITQDVTLKTEAEFISTKEATADNKESFAKREQELKNLQSRMESGDLSPEVAMKEMEALEIKTP